MAAAVLLLLGIITSLPNSVFTLINLLFGRHFYTTQETSFKKYRSEGGGKASFLKPTFYSIISVIFISVISLTGLLYSIELAKVAIYDARFERGRHLMEADSLDLAKEIFNDYKESFPDETAAYWNQSVIYSEQDKSERA